MRKAKNFSNRLIAMLLSTVMIFALILESMPVYAAESGAETEGIGTLPEETSHEISSHEMVRQTGTGDADDIKLFSDLSGVLFAASASDFSNVGGWNESIYAEIAGVKAADVTEVSWSGAMSGKLDADGLKYLVRDKGSNVRIDIPGLKAGTYTLTVKVGGSTLTKSDIEVYAYDRSGYAHFNYTDGVGAYNDDGTLKDNAIVLYVTDENKNTVSLKYGNTTVTGIGNILNNSNIFKNLAQAGKPLAVRFIGCVSETELYKQGSYDAKDAGKIDGLTDYVAGNDNGHMARICSGKDITLEGIGYDAVIDGWGFHYVAQSSNPSYGKSFEVRNLTFINTPEDAVGMEGAQADSNNVNSKLSSSVERCWIHHNEFYCPEIENPAEDDKAEGDGSVDFKRGQYFTCSYNYFDKCHKTNLVGANKNSLQYNMTYHHNYWYMCKARGPLARNANIHMYNNVVEMQRDYVQNARANSYIFSEYNLFYASANPQNIDGGSDGNGVIKSYCDSIASVISMNNPAKVVSDKKEYVPNNCQFSGENIKYDKFDTDSSLSYIPDNNYKLDTDFTELRKVVASQTGVQKQNPKRPEEITAGDYSVVKGTTANKVDALPKNLTPGKVRQYAFTVNEAFDLEVAYKSADTAPGVLVNEAGENLLTGDGSLTNLPAGTYMIQAKNFQPWVPASEGKAETAFSFKEITINTLNITKTTPVIVQNISWDFAKLNPTTDIKTVDGVKYYAELILSGNVSKNKDYLLAKEDATITVPNLKKGDKVIVKYCYEASFTLGETTVDAKSESTSQIDKVEHIVTADDPLVIKNNSTGKKSTQTYFCSIEIVKAENLTPYTSVLYVGQDKAYKTIGDALAVVRKMTRTADQKVTIMIDPGNYEEMLVIDMPNITLQNASATPSIDLKNKGVDIDKNAVRITWYYGHGYTYYSMGSDCKYDAELLAANKSKGSASFTNPGAGTTNGSYWNATVVISANNFTAKDIIFENSFNQYVSAKSLEDVIKAQTGQEGAKEGTVKRADMKTLGDTKVQEKDYVERAAALAITNNCKEVYFNKCKFVGRQDTLYGGTGVTAGFEYCSIYGGTDYIFGGMTAVFKQCDLVFNTNDQTEQGLKNDVGYITAPQQAAGRGYLLYKCKVTSTVPGVDTASAHTSKPGYLGRPWAKNTGEAVFYKTTIEKADLFWNTGSYSYGESLIRSAGWGDGLNGQSALCGEYGTIEESGVDNSSKRVSWSKVFTEEKLADGTTISIKSFLKDWEVPFDSDDPNVPVPKQYTITIDRQNGTASEVKTVAEGTALTETDLPTPTREGYTFTGWVDGSNKSVTLPYTPTANVTIKATWEKIIEIDPDVLYNKKLISLDIPTGTYTSDFQKNGFIITAGEGTDQSVSVDVGSEKTIGGTKYTGRLKTGGIGTKDYRSIKITTEDAATLTMACVVATTGDECELGVATLNDKGEFVEITTGITVKNETDNKTTTPNKIILSGSKGNLVTVKLPAADTYYIYSKGSTLGGNNSGGVNFYAINVTYANGVDPVFYTVTFDSMGGMSEESQKVQAGDACVEPAEILKSGYTFDGWYADSECTQKYDFSAPVKSNLTLYAKWLAGEPDSEYLVLDMKDLPARDYKEVFKRNGFTFNAASDKHLSVDVSAVTVDGTDYTRRLKLNGEGSTSDRNVSFTIEADATLTLVAESGKSGTSRALKITNGTKTYDISNIDAAAKYTQELTEGTWQIYAAGEGVNIYYISVKGEAVKAQYVIAIDRQDGTEAVVKTVVEGTELTETDLPSTLTKEGYTFLGWEDENGEVITVPYTPTKSMTIRAKWRQDVVENQYTITIDKQDGTEAIEKVIVEGTELTESDLPATLTKEGYTFLGWEDENGEAITAPYTPTKSMTIRAKWQSDSPDPGPDPDPGPGPGPDPNPGPDDPIDPDEVGLHVRLKNPDETYTYTGSAIKPAIVVSNNGKRLVEGRDYTVKYSNNVKACEWGREGDDVKAAPKNAPKITVTGKGNFSGSTFTNFRIAKKDIGENDTTDDTQPVEAGAVTVAKNSKATPILVYNGMKLGAKDYIVDAAQKNKKWGGATEEDEIFDGDDGLKLVGNGNYKGSRIVTVKAVKKDNLKTFTVTVGKVELTYDSTSKELPAGTVTVKDKKDKTLNLTEHTDYEIVYSGDTVSAGTVKFSVVGIGNYTGTVTKTYKIKPMSDSNQIFVDETDKEAGYAYDSQGVTVGDDIKVYYGSDATGTLLEEGTDYKLSYSKNKKLGKAGYTVTLQGNFKGAKKTGTFKIEAASLKDSEAKVESADKVFKKEGVYKSAPIVTINGVALKASDYKVEYGVEDSDGKVADGAWGQKPKVTAAGTTIKVKVTGKGNYKAGDDDCVYGEYTVCDKGDKTDLAGAKVTFYEKNADGTKGRKVTKLDYTGTAVEPAIVEVTIKGRTEPLKPDEDYTIVYVNNTNKGKATVIITAAEGSAKYVGSKTAAFSIVAKNLKTLPELMNNLFKIFGK